MTDHLNDRLHDRRGAIRLGAITVGGVAGAWALGVEDVIRGVADSGSAAAAAETVTGCATLTPEETEGPYWVDERLNRSDVRSDTDTGAVKAGVPLTLTMTVTDAGDSCTVQPGVYVDIWHCDAQGLYSAVSTNGNSGQGSYDYLRGYQVTDANGKVTFTTIFPGWYTGRTVHIHFRVRTSLDGAAVNFTSQLYFQDSVSNAVYASSSAYARNQSRDTTNSTDDIYDASNVVPLTGNTTSGYTGAFTVNLDFGGEDGTGTSGGSSTSDTVARAALLDAWVTRGRLGRRYLKVTTWNGEQVTPLVRLVRGDRVLASRRFAWWAAGRRTRAVVIPKRVKRGTARAYVRFTDRSGNTKLASVLVHVPRRKR